MKRNKIYKVIDGERDYQDLKWGGRGHDEKNSLGDWIYYIRCCLNNAKAYYDADEIPDSAILSELRQVVALGIACFEIHGVPDRFKPLNDEYV